MKIIDDDREVRTPSQINGCAINGTTKPKTCRGTKRPIVAWIILSFACTFANVYIGHRRVNFFSSQLWRRYQHNHLPPHQRHNENEATLNIGQRYHLREDPITHDGDHITAILRGEKPFPHQSQQQQRLKYRPGDLKMSSAEALQQCYVDKSLYENHMNSGSSALVSMSRRHKLIYRNIPKSASSSARLAMKNYFRGKDVRMKFDDLNDRVNRKNYTLVSFVREPSDRFYSSYDEAFYRMGPWMGHGVIAERMPRVAKAYLKNKHKMDKYPYLYRNMWELNDYRGLYCPDEILNGGGNYVQACNEAQSIDDGTLVQRFEEFVHDYDGLDPFDVHLNLQVPSLVDGNNGQPFPVSSLYDASEADEGWRHIADGRGVKMPNELMVGRKSSRRFNLSMVSDATKQKICRILALDYCCLNIELPAICTKDKSDGVYCAMEKKTMNKDTSRGRNDGIQRLVIGPWKNA